MANRWKDLSERTRRRIVVIGAVEGVLKVVALADLRGRRPEEVAGSRGLWALAIVLVNSAGALPLVYLLRGRRSKVSTSFPT